MSCLFCQIASKKIPATLLFEDEQVLAFNDIVPQAPVHVLIIPKQHIESLNQVQAQEASLLAHIIFTAQHLATTLHIAESGYRLVFNTHAQGGQTVYHLHGHLLGGRQLTWPPG